jgi:hypothetical protein
MPASIPSASAANVVLETYAVNNPNSQSGTNRQRRLFSGSCGSSGFQIWMIRHGHLRNMKGTGYEKTFCFHNTNTWIVSMRKQQSSQ